MEDGKQGWDGAYVINLARKKDPKGGAYWGGMEGLSTDPCETQYLRAQ